MSILIENNGKSYFRSKDVKVFPCSYRGTYINKTSIVGEATTDSETFAYDPESRLTTENNIVNIPGNRWASEKYLIAYDKEQDILKFVLGGYYFEVYGGYNSETVANSLKGVYLIVNTKTINLTGQEDVAEISTDNVDRVRTTKILTSLNKDSQDLDIEISGINCFTGLACIESPDSTDNYTACLGPIFNADSSLNRNLENPKIYSGSTDYSLRGNESVAANGNYSSAFGEATIAKAKAQTVVGKFNAEADGQFIIGNGTTSTRGNSFVANEKTISIDNILKVKDGEKETVSIDPATVIASPTTNISLSTPTITITGNNSTINSTSTIAVTTETYTLTAPKINATATASVNISTPTLLVDKRFSSTTSDTTITTSAINLKGNTSIEGTGVISGATTLKNTLTVTGATQLNSTLTVSGACVINNTLSVDNATTLGGNLTINGSDIKLTAATNNIFQNNTQIITMSNGNSLSINTGSFVTISTPTINIGTKSTNSLTITENEINSTIPFNGTIDYLVPNDDNIIYKAHDGANNYFTLNLKKESSLFNTDIVFQPPTTTTTRSRKSKAIQRPGSGIIQSPITTLPIELADSNAPISLTATTKSTNEEYVPVMLTGIKSNGNNGTTSTTITLFNKDGNAKLNDVYVNLLSASTVSVNTLSASTINGTSAHLTSTLTVDGAITADNYNATSDARLKENIIPFEYSRSILDLPIYKYNFIGEDSTEIGCLAQDLEKLYPELVTKTARGYLAIKETKLIYLLLEEIKKLKTEVDNLKNK